jgi:hypothetical protein
MGFAKTRQDPPKRLDVIGDRRRRRWSGSDFRVAPMYTRVGLGHDIVDITPSNRMVATEFNRCLPQVAPGLWPSFRSPKAVGGDRLVVFRLSDTCPSHNAEARAEPT